MQKFFHRLCRKMIAIIACGLVLGSVFCCGCGSAPQAGQQETAYSVTDASGARLQLAAKPQRIISLTISADEILLGLVGPERIAAVTYLADEPEISNIAGRVQTIAARVHGNEPEHLLALQPDLIIAADFMKPEMIQTLRDLHLQVYVYHTPDNLQQIKARIRDLGQLVGEEARAAQLVTAMEARLAAVQAKLGTIGEGERKSVLAIGSDGAYYRPENHFTDLCRYAQVEDAAQRLHYAGEGFIAQEEIVRLDPDIFAVVSWNYDGKHAAEKIRGEILANPSYRTTRAVQNGRVIVLPGNHFMARSRYTVDAVEELAQAVYPEKFTNIPAQIAK